MKRRGILALILILALVPGLFAQAGGPGVSEKKELAVFGLGWSGWIIPLEALGSIDSEIRGVFSDLGRFTIIGATQRFASADLPQFIEAIKKAKAQDFVMPEKYQFGEAVFTEAEFNRLLGAFIVAAPVITSFWSSWNATAQQWETSISTDVSFIDVSAGGSLISMARIRTSGSDKTSQLASVSSAIEAIPSQLQFEIRSIPAFQINTRVLSSRRGEVRVELGSNMGIRKGDEYAVVETTSLEGLKDEKEVGLVLIKEVGPQISTATVLYGSGAIGKDSRLKEIPRFGMDAEAFLRLLGGDQATVVPGLRLIPTRGFYGLKPYLSAQIPLGAGGTIDGSSVIPISVALGGQYELHLGRLTLAPYVGAGLSWAYLSSGSTAENYFPQAGVQAFFQASWLSSRDLRFFAEAGGEYWASLNSYFPAYYGLGFDAGIAFKL
jgi:hypothetical protein